MEVIGCPVDILAPDQILCHECRESGMHKAGIAEIAAADTYFRHGTPEEAIQKLDQRKQSALLSMKPGTKEVTDDQAKEEIIAYYDHQIQMVRDGTHPSFPTGYVIVVRN